MKTIIDLVTSIKSYIDDKKMSKTNPTGTGSFSLNRKSESTVGTNSFAEGFNGEASGNYSHAEGNDTVASGDYSHAEGAATIASGIASHSEGSSTTASGAVSHAEGAVTLASGTWSHAEGVGTVAAYQAQHISGKYNSNKSETLFEVGNGTTSTNRSNAFEVYSDGKLSTDNGITKVKLEDLATTSDVDDLREVVKEQSLIAEGYATGTQDGVPVTSGQYFHNNSKYHSEQSATKASQASTSAIIASNKANAAATSETNAANSAATALTKADEAAVSASTASTKAEETSANAQIASEKALDASDSAERAENAKRDVYGAIGIPEFTVDFVTGLLMYSDQSKYTFMVDHSTGQLTYNPI